MDKWFLLAGLIITLASSYDKTKNQTIITDIFTAIIKQMRFSLHSGVVNLQVSVTFLTDITFLP
jgi:hypothetical protein